jgi:hypothetical protein
VTAAGVDALKGTRGLESRIEGRTEMSGSRRPIGPAEAALLCALVFGVSILARADWSATPTCGKAFSAFLESLMQ